jgi:WD40 repeat protein
MKSIGKLGKTISGQPAAICWSPDGRKLAVSHPSACVSIYTLIGDQSGLNAVPDVLLETGTVTEIHWDAAGSTLMLIDSVNASEGLNVSVWDLATHRQIRTQHISAALLSAWNADFTIEIRAEGNRLSLHDKMVEVSCPLITHVQLSANGQTAVVIVDDPRPNRHPFRLSRDKVAQQDVTAVEVWDVITGNRLCLYRPGIQALAELHISPNGQFYALRGYYHGGDGDEKRNFSIYERSTSKEIFRDWGFFDDVPILSTWSVDNQQMIYWTWTKTLTAKAQPYIGIVDMVGREEYANEKAFRHAGLAKITPADLAWSPDKTLLAVGDISGMIHLYRL